MNEIIRRLAIENAKLNIDERLFSLSNSDREKGVPTLLIEGLNELLLILSIKNPKNILELGTATGCSGIAMLLNCGDANLTTVELMEKSYNTAKQNFEHFGLTERVTQICNSAEEAVKTLEGKYDFIFLDCNKSSYIRMLPRLKELLNSGGVLFADNVLFRGYITKEVQTPRRFRTIRNNLTKFLEAISNDKDFITMILQVGDGISISYKK